MYNFPATGKRGNGSYSLDAGKNVCNVGIIIVIVLSFCSLHVMLNILEIAWLCVLLAENPDKRVEPCQDILKMLLECIILLCQVNTLVSLLEKLSV